MWRVVYPIKRKRKWELQDASNVLATKRNGVGLRFCQDARGDYFLHLLNTQGDPVRITCPIEEAEPLLREIGKTVHPLGRFLAFLDSFNKEEPAAPKRKWWQNILNHPSL